jgi:hypothetical protein
MHHVCELSDELMLTNKQLASIIEAELAQPLPNLVIPSSENCFLNSSKELNVLIIASYYLPIGKPPP